MANCSVCCEKFNKSTRREILCENKKCNYSACFECTKTYLLDKSYQEPHCMSCKNVWSLSILVDKLSKHFIKTEYRKMREKVLFEEEKTFLPELQDEAERRIKIERIKGWMNYYREQIDLNDKKEDQLVSTQREKHRELREKEGKMITIWKNLEQKPVDTIKKSFIMKCIIENCRGFLSKEYKCGICNIKVCKDCHNVIDDEHKCNKDDIETVKELQKTTKPCPKCHTRIYKIDGCDQMFCIQCHTPFSWTSGEVATGVIHNPHYFEMLRNGKIIDQRHQQHQGECGPIPNFNVISRYLIDKDQNHSNFLTTYYQRFIHYRHIVLPQFLQRIDSTEDRIKYLMGQYDEEKFKQKVYVINQTNLRKREEQQIMETFVSIGEELYRTLRFDNTIDIIKQIYSLIIITSNSIIDLDNKYEHVGLRGMIQTIKSEKNCIKQYETYLKLNLIY